MRIIASRNEVCLKIVFYGPGLSGKTTNLLRLHERLPSDARGELIQLDTDTERTLFFDYFPASAGKVGKYTIKLDFFTVPGQSFYAATREAVLFGVDGLVFVADSSPEREQANLVSHADMVSTLAAQGRDLATMPHVYQWNKRDLKRALPTRLMSSMLNPHGASEFEAIASEGVGVHETQQEIARLALAALTKPQQRTARV